jgi:hypothetical protein
MFLFLLSRQRTLRVPRGLPSTLARSIKPP